MPHNLATASEAPAFARRPAETLTPARFALAARLALAAALVLVIAGCVSRKPDSFDRDADDGPDVRRAQKSDAGKRSRKPKEILGVTPMQLNVWNSPSFQREFAESYIAVTDVEPTVTSAEQEILQKVLQQMQDGKLDEAATLIDENMTDASSPVFDFFLANIHFQNEAYDKAAEWYEKAVDPDGGHPKFRRAWKNLAMVHVRRENFEDALPALIKVVELGGGDALTYGLMGYAHSSVGNSIAAESAYRQAMLLDPKYRDWKMGLARSFFRQERYGEAAALTGYLLQEEPDDANLWKLQANAYLGLERPLDAAKNYEFVDQLGASTYETLTMLGDIYVNEELFSLSAAAYAKAFEMNPDAKPDRAIRAAKLMAGKGAMKQTDQLVSHIEELVGDRLTTDQRKDLFRLSARVAASQGEGEKRVEDLEQLVRLDPTDGGALILLGQTYAQMGQTDKAIHRYEQAAGIEGHEADALVRHAQLLVRQRDYKNALPLLRRAQQAEYRENVQEYLEQVEKAAASQ